MVTNIRSSRRDVVRALAGLGLAQASALVFVPGCGIYEAESGDAFEPWDFPGSEPVAERLVARAALLAASPHNTQPWGLAIDAASLAIRARLDRSLGAMDSLFREMHIGLGCAIENAVIAARARGRTGDVALLPSPADPALVARVSLAPGPTVASDLFDAMASRHTNRGRYVDAPPSVALERALRDLVDEPRVELHWLASDERRRRFREETVAATVAITEDAEMSADSERWYRHSAEEIEEHRDGTTLDASGNGAATRTFGKALGRPSTATANAYWLEATRSRQTTGSAFAILSTSAESTREDQLRTGRVYQRLHLWATTQGLAMQPLNQLAERQDREETRGLPPRFGDVLRELVGGDRRAQMLFRIGYPWDAAFASPRRPLAWVLA